MHRMREDILYRGLRFHDLRGGDRGARFTDPQGREKEGVRKKLQDLTANMDEKGFLSPGRLWGAPRFELMIKSLCRRGLAQIYGSVEFDGRPEVQEGQGRDFSFNEARRAAEWMIQRWGL